jgi:hypothetical protein
MKNIIIALGMTFAVAGCTATEQGAVTGGAIGAAAGAIVADDDLEGAVIGGAIGAATGALIGRASERRNYCEYRDRRGNIYVDRCPDGYSW